MCDNTLRRTKFIIFFRLFLDFHAYDNDMGRSSQIDVIQSIFELPVFFLFVCWNIFKFTKLTEIQLTE